MRKGKALWIFLLVIGTLPFLTVLYRSFDAAINGFTFLWGAPEFGLAGFTGCFMTHSYVLWPTYIIGFVLIIVSVVFLLRSKSNRRA